jgi:hypothetical protein
MSGHAPDAVGILSAQKRREQNRTEQNRAEFSYPEVDIYLIKYISTE